MAKLKWMKRLRLVNWHYFKDETLEFGRQSIITGRNASGKSTIVDALQVLFVANQRQMRFNSAAHEDAKRSLISYLRGKVGSQSRACLREEDFTSYIVAEFRDQKRLESFVIGAVFDVFLDDSIHDEYFIIPDCSLDDLELISPSGALYNREQFRRQQTRRKGRFERSKGAYQKALLMRLGGIDDRFFSVFTKALSFRPLEDVRDFVNSYILDEKELDLALMKENFELHEQYERELTVLEERRAKLMHITEQFKAFSALTETVTQQEYVILRLRAHQQEERWQQLSRQVQSLERNINEVNSELTLLREQKKQANAERDEAYRRWQGNELLRRQEDLENRLRELASEQKRAEHAWEECLAALAAEQGLLESFFDLPNDAWWQWGEGDSERVLQIVEQLQDLRAPGSLLEENSLPNLQTALEASGDFLASMHNRLLKATARLEDSIRVEHDRAAQLEQEIADLKQRRITYREPVRRLKQLLEARLGQRSPVWVFCEEMEVLDEQWRNAIEGYLNTQRFDLLVRPEVFAEALAVYEREKRRHNLDGVGLVDTEKEHRYLGQRQSSSLAEFLESKNQIVQARIDHLLGQVMRAGDEQELRQHRTAVTASCMSYHNLVARQIPCKNYEVPYIGAAAIVRQLDLKQREYADLKLILQELTTSLSTLEGWGKRLAERGSRYRQWAGMLAMPLQIAQRAAAASASRQELAAIDQAELDRLRAEWERWQRREIELSDKIAQLDREIGRLGADLTHKQQEQEQAAYFLQQAEAAWQAWQIETSPEQLQKAELRWQEAAKQALPIEQRIQNWESNRKRNETLRSEARNGLVKLRADYNRAYAYNSDPEASTNQGYDQLLDKIAGIDIPDFQTKLEAARQQSEEEFKSHFVYKLREAISQARLEFQRLNLALRSFPFHEDQYRFEVRPSDKYRRYYDAIMDPQVAERDSLFALIGDDHSTALHELFERLIDENLGEQAEFTDYRRYLDFDIIISDSRGEETRFSKVLREKSGGETQTPFYIVILAAFNQLYAPDKAMRLVVFDEAFNKMDEERIQTSLRLVKQLNLQLIAAVPDEKMQHMAPEVETTLLVSRDGYNCFVDRISRREVQEVANSESEDVPEPITLFTAR